MKKLVTLFLSIFITSTALASVSNTSAIHLDEEGNTWWTVEELLDFSETADLEEEALCGNDFNCREELYFSRFESEDKRYGLLNLLKENRFWITSINPTEETLEILYFDEDEMLKRWGIEEHQPLDFIFLAWFDNINGQVGNYDPNLPIEPQFSDDLHLLYADSSEAFSTDGFPVNTPFELPIHNTNLNANNLGRIYLAVFGEDYNSKGYLDYSSCLDGYTEGDTCKLMFSSGKGYSYLSPKQGILSENEQGETNDEPLETGSLIEGLGSEIGSKEESKPTAKATSPSSSPIKAPNTGKGDNSCEKIVEFPWWLGILIVVGNIVFLWFFGPNFKKRPHKTLDKNI